MRDLWRLDWRSYLLGVGATWIADATSPAARKILRPLWLRLTYWRVRCDGCEGTGLCKGPNQLEPHSCCGGCHRRWVNLADVPAGFMNSGGRDKVLIGDGIMWRRPWSRRQVQKP
jgi:hypothetical protein